MLVALLHPDAAIDGHEAGYFLSWSRDEGVSNEAIVAAFECR
jgi:hypothetical protein